MESQFIIENLVSALLGVCAGLFNAWAAKRYVETEKRYLIGGAITLVGLALILAYQFLNHRWTFLLGPYMVVVFLFQWIVRFKSNRAH